MERQGKRPDDCTGKGSRDPCVHKDGVLPQSTAVLMLWASHTPSGPPATSWVVQRTRETLPQKLQQDFQNLETTF